MNASSEAAGAPSGAGTAGALDSASAGGGTTGAGAGGAHGAGHPGNNPSGIPLVYPQAEPPPKVGDGTIADPGNVPAGTGWDACFATPSVALATPGQCAGCPSASLGSSYLLFGVNGTTPPTGSAPFDPQMSFFFDAPVVAQGLWFDVYRVSGDAAATLVLWSSTAACFADAPLHLYDIGPLLTVTPGQWTTGCVPVATFGSIGHLDLRIETSASVALDAVRFGPACAP